MYALLFSMLCRLCAAAPLYLRQHRTMKALLFNYAVCRNAARQSIVYTFKRMKGLRSSEQIE